MIDKHSPASGSNPPYILSETVIEYPVGEEVLQNTAVAVNLYYPDTLERYFEYIRRVPEKIPVYIYCSNKAAQDAIADFAASRKNVVFEVKENRGRDVSALLVNFREIARTRKYICFIHDKKAHTSELAEDTEFWIRTLWDNTLMSEEYIINVLGLMERENIGLCMPPKALAYTAYWYFSDGWKPNFDNTVKLARELGISHDIKKDSPILSLGTVFWGRTDALRKLLDVDWKYEDFPEEPMPGDGTISHAIERILSFLSEDAGYPARLVVSNSYMREFYLKLQDSLLYTFDILSKAANVHSLKELESLAKRQEEVRDKYLKLYMMAIKLLGLKQEGKKLSDLLHNRGYNTVAVYGMSYMGQRLIKELLEEGIPVLYGIDRNAAKIHSKIDIVKPTDELKEVDVIINTTTIDEAGLLKGMNTKKLKMVNLGRLLEDI